MDYNEIIKEAQDIMQNLFEVSYYGANDVEEEQNNKIKKQGKDKNGNKVDLVSVQDELFPYEGTAKEQYNKKIIAKINDMIEGKATLEDLIQLVRRKRVTECYEGAIEILEKYTDDEKREAAKKAFPKRKEDLNKIADELDDIMNKNGYEYSGDIHIAKPKGWPYGKSQLNKDVEDKIGQYKRALNRAHHAKKVSECYEGAIELIESVLDAILKSDKSDEKKSELRSKLAKARATERELADEKAMQSWLKGDLKNSDVSVIRNPEFTKNASGERKTRLRSADNHYDSKNGSLKIKPEWKQVSDSIKRHEKKSK